jgi:hypothetical protein
VGCTDIAEVEDAEVVGVLVIDGDPDVAGAAGVLAVVVLVVPQPASASAAAIATTGVRRDGMRTLLDLSPRRQRSRTDACCR